MLYYTLLADKHFIEIQIESYCVFLVGKLFKISYSYASALITL